jgi:hypothetical protein
VSLSSARSLHTATLLPREGHVVLIGGYFQTDAEKLRTTGPTKTYDIYDPATDTLVATGDLRVARAEHSATLLPDGRIVVAGGYGEGHMLDQIEILNPAKGTSTLIRDRLKTPRSGHVAILDSAHDRIYFIGGLTRDKSGALSATDSTEILNLKNFSIEPSSEKLSKARGGLVSVQVAEDRYVLLGGTASENLIDSFTVCDKASPAGDCTEIAFNGNKTKTSVKVKTPGTSALGNIEIFDLNTSSIYEGPKLNHARAGMVAAPLGFSMNAILVYGGATAKFSLETIPEVVVYK